MPRLRIGDAEITYDVRGHGPTVVQLHGLTSSRWREAALRLDVTRRLHDHTVLKYDARGHGESTGDLDVNSYTWSSLADDLLFLLDEICPEQRVHGVGPSMGTGTLLHAAVRQPERFTGLTLVIPSTAWATRVEQSRKYLQSAELIEQRGLSTFVRLSRMVPQPPAVDPTIPPTEPTVPESLLPTIFRGAALSDLPDPADLAKLDIPTLILAWVDDPSHPLSTSQELLRVMPNARLEVAYTPQDVAAWPTLLEEQVSLQPH
ncbi:alpha/beta fold hydrolase [Dermacoccaceae bacterium W4C1]